MTAAQVVQELRALAAEIEKAHPAADTRAARWAAELRRLGNAVAASAWRGSR